MFRRLLLAVALLGLALPASAQSQDPSFRLHNRGNIVINEIYVSSVNVDEWGDDLLGADVLQPGQFLLITIQAGQCMNAVRVVYANGEAQEVRAVNTCNLTDMAFPQ